MRHRTLGGLALLVAVVLAAPAAEAQTRIFAGAGVAADHDQTNSALTDKAGTLGTIVVGMDVTRRIGIRFVFDTPREVRTGVEGTYLRPPATLPVHEALTRTRRSMTYGLLGDVHGQVAPRLRLAATFGLVTVTHDSETIIVRHELRPDGARARLSDLRDVGDHDWSGFAGGVECAVMLTGRIEIVPEVRLIYFGLSDSPAPYIVRPGIGIRWRF